MDTDQMETAQKRTIQFHGTRAAQACHHHLQLKVAQTGYILGHVVSQLQ
jgi:hypothetical protein